MKNYDENTLAAYKRSLSGISNQILEDDKEVTMHSNIKMSHFIVFEKLNTKLFCQISLMKCHTY